MQLREFVSETLKEIITGVKEAQGYASENGAEINPEVLSGNNKIQYVLAPDGGAIPVREIDFDVAVTSADTTEQQAGAGIFVAALGFGVKDKSDTLNSCVSRIKFSVGIVLPLQAGK